MSEKQDIIKAIDAFAEEMKKRMLSKAKQGWKGWDQNRYPDRLLRNAAAAAVNDNPQSMIDCANFCMIGWMAYNRKVAVYENKANR